MSTVIDFKNAIRDAIIKQDEKMNFYFNKIEKVIFPYCFLYFSDKVTFSAPLDEQYYREVNFPCVIEYMKSATNSTEDLWSYEETLAQALKLFQIYDTKVEARNIEFNVVEDVLQMTFDVQLFVKIIDETELMKELEFTIKGV